MYCGQTSVVANWHHKPEFWDTGGRNFKFKKICQLPVGINLQLRKNLNELNTKHVIRD